MFRSVPGHSRFILSAFVYCLLFNCFLLLLLLVTALVLQVFPAHGAGSPCGKNLRTALYSTIGQEIATNPALQFTEVRDKDGLNEFLSHCLCVVCRKLNLSSS